MYIIPVSLYQPHKMKWGVEGKLQDNFRGSSIFKNYNSNGTMTDRNMPNLGNILHNSQIDNIVL